MGRAGSGALVLHGPAAGGLGIRPREEARGARVARGVGGQGARSELDGNLLIGDQPPCPSVLALVLGERS